MSHQFQPTPVEQPAKPRHPKGAGRVAVAVYAGLAGLIIGGIGASGDTTTTVEPAAQPKPKTRIVTKTVTETPDACRDAIAEADRIVEAFQWETDWIVKYLTAVSELDVARMEKLNDEMSGLGDKYEGVIPSYRAAAAACEQE